MNTIENVLILNSCKLRDHKWKKMKPNWNFKKTGKEVHEALEM